MFVFLYTYTNLSILKLNNLVLCDAPEPWQLGFQDPATPAVEGMLFFHNYLMLFLIVIGFFVCWMLYYVYKNFNSLFNTTTLKFTHSSLLEIIWTILPAICLLIVAIPSFTLLYSLDELIDPLLTLKVIGHQWYWSYEYSDYVSMCGDSLIFDSYMISGDDLMKGRFRLLEVDNKVFLPILSHIRVLVTASDVIHSWAIPSFGLKVDACPGRLSQASLFLKREGIYFGQCSEICGVNHGFMPIVVEGLSGTQFVQWISEKLNSEA